MKSKCSKGYKKINGKCLFKKKYQSPPIYNFGGVHIGSGFFGFLTLIFITLKLIHIIDWSWWWILSPLWIPAAIALIIFLVFMLIARLFR